MRRTKGRASSQARASLTRLISKPSRTPPTAECKTSLELQYLRADSNHHPRTYVNESTAKADGLVSVANNKLTLRADYTTKLSSSGSGRKSFRIESTSQYKTHVAMYVYADLWHECEEFYYTSSVSTLRICRKVVEHGQLFVCAISCGLLT